ncbi:hypothetical protein KFD70_23185 [Bacillus pfraonensis]|uniref:hypothetical protein n=1 Tax=Bacillus TaxID=1386 RepID=UPI002A4FEC60|nr:hypothetical protein [Bacillus pseudomycoides]
MQPIKIGKWILDVDIEKTREFYQKEFDTCKCQDCRNYYILASNELKPAISDIFSLLGITPSKPAGLSAYPTENSEILLYMGHYHFVGKMLKGPLCTTSHFTEENTIELDGFCLGISEELLFVPEEFPEPILQLEFETKLSYVLHEKE